MLDIKSKVMTSHGEPYIGYAVKVLIGHRGLNIRNVNKNSNRSRMTKYLVMMKS